MKKFTFSVLLAILSMVFTQVKATSTVNETDSLALVSIYNAANGAAWSNASTNNWLSGKVSTWSGVTIRNNRVAKLYLNDLGITKGTLSSSIGQLTELDTLEIQDETGMTGTIPSDLWKCTKIRRLQIKFCGFTGGIPTFGISNMSLLYEINFQGTILGGSIPDSIFTLPKLGKAYLHQSGFTGTVPSTLTQATKLERLYLHGNKLSGGLPFVDLSSVSSTKIELTGNYFSFADCKTYYNFYHSLSNVTLTNTNQLAIDTTSVSISTGNSYTLALTVADADAYTWVKGEDAVSTSNSYTISAATSNDAGTYVCHVTNNNLPNFEIYGVYKLTVNTSTSVNQINDNKYLNIILSENKIQISSESEIKNVKLFDLTGKLIYSNCSTGTSSFNVDMNTLKNGIYIVNVTNAEGVAKTQKIVKL